MRRLLYVLLPAILVLSSLPTNAQKLKFSDGDDPPPPPPPPAKDDDDPAKTPTPPPPPLPKGFRLWTDRNGGSTAAKFLKIQGNDVFLQFEDGSVGKIPIDQLSDNDQTHAKEAMKLANKPAPAKKTRAARNAPKTYPKLSSSSTQVKRNKDGTLTKETIDQFRTEWMDSRSEKRINFSSQIVPLHTGQPVPAGHARILLSAQLIEIDMKRDKRKDARGKVYFYITDLEGKFLVKKESRRLSEMKMPTDGRLNGCYSVVLPKTPIIIVVWTKYQKMIFGQKLSVDLRQIP